MRGLDAIAARVAPLFPPGAAQDLRIEPLRSTGIAHDHYCIRSERDGRAVRDWLLRVPRFSLFDLPPHEGLRYEAACFERLAPIGRAPALAAVLDPDDALPRGGLVVAFAAGRRPAVPKDLDAIAETMAATHAAAVPGRADRAPLRSPKDPIADMLHTIERQSVHIEPAGTPEETTAILLGELAAAKSEAALVLEAGPVAPVVLTLADAHPGNFLISHAGRAIFLDAEKLIYGAPAADLAHATMYPSATWESGPQGAPTAEAVIAFYRAYQAAVVDRLGPDPARSIARLHPIFRRLLWLRTTTFFARWRAELSTLPTVAAVLDDRLRRHIDERIDDCLAPGTVDAIRQEWRAPGPVSEALRDMAD